MDKTTQLFVRACKADNTGKRIRSVYRRFYLNSHQVDVHLVHILCKICIDLNILKPMQLLTELSPENDWKYAGLNWHQRTINVLAGLIRFTNRDQLPGLTAPIYFRRKEAA